MGQDKQQTTNFNTLYSFLCETRKEKQQRRKDKQEGRKRKQQGKKKRKGKEK